MPKANPSQNDPPQMPPPEYTQVRPVVVGWREYVGLPDWGIEHVKAKIDTGARTSAIDVTDMEMLPDNRVRFDIVVARQSSGMPDQRVTVETALVRSASVKSSFGSRRTRPIVETCIRIGHIERVIQLGLVCRKRMRFRMLLGRTALIPNVVVDASHKYVLGGKPNKRKRSEPKERP